MFTRPLIAGKRALQLACLALPLVLSACFHDDDDDNGNGNGNPPAMAAYRVTVINTTNNQPLSPLALVLHDASYSAWTIGGAAGPGLEVLAESGAPDDFLAEASATFDTDRGAGVVMPAASDELEVSAVWRDDLALTVVTMLVNTNDAFTGFSGIAVGGMALGERRTLLAPVYDAGTEANDELLANIPGPAAGGEGYNAARESRDQVTRHPGVVSRDDGYAESVLDQSHRFDNGAMRVIVERVL